MKESDYYSWMGKGLGRFSDFRERWKIKFRNTTKKDAREGQFLVGETKSGEL